MLWLLSNRESLAASADNTASCVSITWLTIVRLIRTWSSMSARRCLIALGTSAPSGPRRITNPRSAWMKILNRLSSSLPSTSSRLTALPRLWAISIMARSLTSGLTASRTPAPLERPTSSFETMVEVAIGELSSTTRKEDPSPLAPGRWSLGWLR